MKINGRQLAVLKKVLHILCFLPLAGLIFYTLCNINTPNLLREVRHFSGLTTLTILLASLFVSPLVRYWRAPLLINCRRLLGLWCFFWATLHLLSYAILTLNFNIPLFFQHLWIKPNLIMGLLAWLIMLPLALTSTYWAQRKLGKYWQSLHNWVYLSLIFAVIHYIWSVKHLSLLPLFYGFMAILALLLRWSKLMKKLQKWQKKREKRLKKYPR